MELQGRVALVAEAGSGVGKAAAVRLPREGASVGSLSETEAEAEETAREIEVGGGEALALVTDVADAVALKRGFDDLAARYGRPTLAELILFIASDRPRRITGTPVCTDRAQSLSV